MYSTCTVPGFSGSDKSIVKDEDLELRISKHTSFSQRTFLTHAENLILIYNTHSTASSAVVTPLLDLLRRYSSCLDIAQIKPQGVFEAHVWGMQIRTIF